MLLTSILLILWAGFLGACLLAALDTPDPYDEEEE